MPLVHRIPPLEALYCQSKTNEDNDGKRLRPFAGLHVVELCGLAPVPFCGRLLADFGAHVTVVLNVCVCVHVIFELNMKMNLNLKNNFKIFMTSVIK
jgi:hypothetical protein